jgi:hypothetical protein
MDIEFDLEEDMSNDACIVSLLNDTVVAKEFYAALCNMQWSKKISIPEDEQIINRLKGNNQGNWSCSWRYAGGIIADIRNNAYNNTSETYLTFYCSGNEGTVSETVRKNFERIGWIPQEWE